MINIKILVNNGDKLNSMCGFIFVGIWGDVDIIIFRKCMVVLSWMMNLNSFIINIKFCIKICKWYY